MSDLRFRASSAASWLFVPGDRPDRFRRAAESGAQVVVLDLEDAVAPERKELARAEVVAFLHDQPSLCVRINAADSPWHDDDVAALATQSRMIMLPKVADTASLDRISGRLAPDSVLVALLESAAGVLDARAVARHPSVARLAFGSHDLAAELGISPMSRSALLRSRSELVLASAGGGLAPPVDGVTVAVHDQGLLADDIRAAMELGFTGKLCIHPKQLETVHELFRPTKEQIAWARGVVEASRAARGGVVLLDGEMVDRPVVERAQRILRGSS